LDPKQQPRRDAEIARLPRQNPPVSFRSIAERLGMSVGSAQTAKKRQEKLDQEISNELDSVSAKDDGDGLAAEDVQTAADCERLNDLELGPSRRIPIIANGWGSGVVVSPEHPRPSGVGPGIGPTTRRSAWVSGLFFARDIPSAWVPERLL
jgi:hypothetical protein